ncbi:hypothetical protein SprV_0301068700 [Sparganum proliferum]
MLITAPVCTALPTPLCSARSVPPFGRSLAHLPVVVAERRTRPWSVESWTTAVHSRVTRSEKSPRRRRHSSALPGG